MGEEESSKENVANRSQEGALEKATEEEPLISMPEQDVEGQSFGWLLLHRRELVFERIATSQDLGPMIRYFLGFSALFSAIYGSTLGFYSLNLQILLSAVKCPMLLLGTMAVCLPALFTFNVLLGSKLSFKQTTAMLSITTYLIATVLVSLAPIELFFMISTEGKHFVLLLNVAAFGISGVFGVKMLWGGMDYVIQRAGYPVNRRIIEIWSLIYMFVGTQLAWILRPFLGTPGEVVLYRKLGGNFYQAVFQATVDLIWR
ncbi:MAG: actin-binding WH2 domain-containing protein [Thermodesulfobacteriota bacterium]